MVVIKEDYVSFETAKLLKDKGFNGVCRYYYPDSHTQLISYVDCKQTDMFGPEACIAPTLQMAMKWLREIHDWIICISPYWAEGDMRNKLTWYYSIHSLIDNRSFRESSYTDNYTEACENAIKYCIKNLI